MDLLLLWKGGASQAGLPSGILAVCPRLQVRSAKDHTGEETALQGVGPRGRTLKTIWTEGAGGSPLKLPS